MRPKQPRARVHTHPAEALAGTEPVDDGHRIGTLRVFATPGHTAGHLSLVERDRGVLLVGDCLGVIDGELVRAPDLFTANRERAEQSPRRLRTLRGARMLFAHGSETNDPWTALDLLLASDHPHLLAESPGG